MEVRINVLLLIGIAALVIMVSGLFLGVDIKVVKVGFVAGIVGLSGKLTDPPPNPRCRSPRSAGSWSIWRRAASDARQ